MSVQDLGDNVLLLSRDEWAQGRQVVGTPGSRAVSDITEFIAHHSGGVTLGDPDPRQWARNIYDFHVHQLLYSDIAYEALVAQHDGKGWILEGRPIGLDSAATYMHNHLGYAACYLRANGDSDQDLIVPPLVQIAYRKLFALIQGVVGHPLVQTDHRNCKGDSTFCPGNDLAGWVQHGGLVAPGHTTPPPAGHPPVHPPLVQKPPVHPLPSTWPAWGGVTLRQGMRQPLVAIWQTRLNQLGAALVVDGAFGPRTLDATRWFQGVHHLATDGIVGPLTWNAAR